MVNPKVAILVAAYNAQQTLDKCMHSLTTQTLGDIEIICIDDCSTDATPQLLSQWADGDPRIHVLHTPHNSGQAVARNLGLQHASAPYICMVDADDWLSTDCLQSAYDIFTHHPQTDCVAFRLILHYDQDSREEDYGMPAELEKDGVTGLRAFELCADKWTLHGCYLTRTELHRRFPYDTTGLLYSDDNTSRLHYLYSREVRSCNGCYFWRQHTVSMTHSFTLRRFDFMEANLALRTSLKDYEHDHGPLPATTLAILERDRWYNFLACCRMYYNHINEIPHTARQSLLHRFATTLATFSSRTLPSDCRHRPGYYLISSPTLFLLQQRLFVSARRMLRMPLP